MARIVVMPKLGLTMTEGYISAWLADVGGAVTAERPLCELETDKITTSMDSPADGILLARVAEGTEVPVGQPIAIIGEAGEDVSQLALYRPGPP
jgi:pyruvate/2-oxoglutarate dehydrogenase complex dihydrolipoamide acyltransferase (E2) component